MTTPMPVVDSYSAIFKVQANTKNPQLESGHPRVGRNIVRVKVPKGVSQIMVKTDWPGNFTVTHQDAGPHQSAPQRIVYDSAKSGGGLLPGQGTHHGHGHLHVHGQNHARRGCHSRLHVGFHRHHIRTKLTQAVV